MKLVKHTTTDMGNVDFYGNTQRSSHWGNKHYFLIENAAPAEIEAIEDMLAAEGWETDGCPCYEDGFGAGFHIAIDEVDQFKADYKAAKKGLKAFMAARDAAPVVEAAPAAVEAAPVITEAHAAQITFYAANDYTARRAIVEAAHADALKDDRAFNSAWQSVARYIDCTTLDAKQTARALTAAHLEALEEDERRARAGVPVPAADISDIDIRTMHEPLEAEACQPYAAKVVTRAYVARSIARALDSQQRHAEKYTAQDVRWLAEHNAEHAHRNRVITGEEFAEVYSLINAADARPLAILEAMRAALLAGLPVLAAARAA